MDIWKRMTKTNLFFQTNFRSFQIKPPRTATILLLSYTNLKIYLSAQHEVLFCRKKAGRKPSLFWFPSCFLLFFYFPSISFLLSPRRDKTSAWGYKIHLSPGKSSGSAPDQWKAVQIPDFPGFPHPMPDGCNC